MPPRRSGAGIAIYLEGKRNMRAAIGKWFIRFGIACLPVGRWRAEMEELFEAWTGKVQPDAAIYVLQQRRRL